MPVLTITPQLRTTDLDGSIRFYTERVGLELEFRHADFYAGIRSNNGRFHLKLVDTPDPSVAFVNEGGHFHLYLGVDDVDSLGERLRTAGIELIQPPCNTDWGTRELAFRDDQGHTIYAGMPAEQLNRTVDVDEDVHVVDSDPTWIAKFVGERTRLAAALGDAGVHLEHVGSTAIPGLPAKPIVDMMLGVETYPPAGRLIEMISALGYENVGEAGVPGRLYFRRRGTNNYNLHVVSYLGAHWRNNIQLRDYLEQSEAARSRYATAKRDAVRAGATRLIAYSEAKAGIVTELLKEASMRAGNSLGRTRA